jgi:hypothetical protein
VPVCVCQGEVKWVLFLFLLYVWTAAIITRVWIGQGVLKEVVLDNGTPVNEMFGTLGDSFVTMMAAITEDGWVTDIARPLMEAGIEHQGPGMGVLYFSLMTIYLFVGTFGILNLLTAIFVEHLYQAQEENEKTRKAEKRHRMLTQLDSLRSIFTDIDRDGNGDLSASELMQCLPALRARHQEDKESNGGESIFSALNVTPETFHELLLYFASDASG